MYPRASYPESPIDSRVFVARSNSASRSAPPARSFDKSCGTTIPRYPSAPFDLFDRGHPGRAADADASLYPDGTFPSWSMGSVRPAGLALVASLLLFWTLLPPAIGQGAAGHMVVSADYELFGLSEPTGGGHVTWTPTEGKAVELRNKILHMFDEYPQIPRGFTYGGAATSSVPDGRIEAAEGL